MVSFFQNVQPHVGWIIVAFGSVIAVSVGIALRHLLASKASDEMKKQDQDRLRRLDKPTLPMSPQRDGSSLNAASSGSGPRTSAGSTSSPLSPLSQTPTSPTKSGKTFVFGGLRKPIGWVKASHYDQDLAAWNATAAKTDPHTRGSKVDAGGERYAYQGLHAASEHRVHVASSVLLVDDSRVALKMIGDLLDKNHILHNDAQDGFDAWAWLSERHTQVMNHVNSISESEEDYRDATPHAGGDAPRMPDLIITDIEMPRLNGIDLIKKLKSDPRFQDIPVLVVSAFPEHHVALMEDGLIEGFVAKPFVPLDLVAQLSYLGAL